MLAYIRRYTGSGWLKHPVLPRRNAHPERSSREKESCSPVPTINTPIFNPQGPCLLAPFYTSPLFPFNFHHVQACSRSSRCRGLQGCDSECTLFGLCEYLLITMKYSNRPFRAASLSRSVTFLFTSTSPQGSSSRYVEPRFFFGRPRKKNRTRFADQQYSTVSVSPRVRSPTLPKRPRLLPSPSVIPT